MTIQELTSVNVLQMWFHVVRIGYLFLLIPALCGTLPAEDVFPDAEWEQVDPTQAGVATAPLDELRRMAGGDGCVVLHGRIVYTWGDPARRSEIASAVKPFYTHFLFQAVADGKIPGLDSPVVEFEPGLLKLNAALDYKDRLIQWRHLCSQTSCYGVTEKPGEAFDYSDYNMALFFDTLFLKVYRSSWETVDRDVLHPLLTDRLQCQDNPSFMAFGTGDRPGRMAISPRDFARFGLLYLRKGKWRDERLLSDDAVRLAVTNPLPNSIPRTNGEAVEMLPEQRSIGGRNNQTDHLGSYSFAWWVNGVGREGQRHWPDVPEDTFGCFGHGGMRAMVVVPVLNAIVAWNNTAIDNAECENRALRCVVEAIRSK